MKIFLKLFFALGILYCIIFFTFFFFHFAIQQGSSQKVFTHPAVTVINPLRGPQLGLENIDLLASLQSQWKVTKDAQIPATWLWQYSAMEDVQMVQFAKSDMQNNCHADFSSAPLWIPKQVRDDKKCNQEFGIFLEVDRNLAQQAHVLYRGQGPWYFSDGLLLVSYDRKERELLIDTVFAKFKKTFGFYPKTVGAWWVGADSLQYMQQKYGIIASLQVADQFNLDVYSVWGTPWSIPYLASRENAAIPAQSFAKSAHIVIMQWASRDPTYGYGPSLESTYSMQDYALKKYDNSYASYLLNIFSKAPFDQIVIGLEGGQTPNAYNGEYKEKLLKIHALAQQQKITIVPAAVFANDFLSRQQVFGSTNYFLSQGYDSQDQSFWFNGTNYRIGIEKQGENIFLVDLRDYTKKGNEDFSLLPNSQGFLRITTPARIDSARSSEQKLFLAHSTQPLQIQKDKNKLFLKSGDKPIVILGDTTISLPSLNSSFSFQRKEIFFSGFLINFFILIIYTGYFISKEKNKIKLFIHISVLLFCLFISGSFFSVGNIENLTFIFDRKEFFLFYFMPAIPLSLLWRLFILFQLVPFILLLTSHWFFVIKGKGENMIFYCYILCVFGFLLLFSHVPNIIVTEFFTRKRFVLVSVMFLYLILVCTTVLFFFYKKKLRKFLAQSVVIAFLVFGLVASTFVFSWQQYIITPFEIDSLEYISNLKYNVYYINPNTVPLYKAVIPFLFSNTSYAEKLTKTHWQKISRPQGRFLTFPTLENTIIFVPRYIGADFYPEEIQMYHLKKIFDNAQIALFIK